MLTGLRSRVERRSLDQGQKEAMDKARFLLCCGQGYRHGDVKFHHSNNVCLLLFCRTEASQLLRRNAGS